MRWIAGIDGGGSKTAVLLRTVDGKETRTCRVGSIDPAEYGVEGYAAGLLAALTRRMHRHSLLRRVSGAGRRRIGADAAAVSQWRGAV